MMTPERVLGSDNALTRQAHPLKVRHAVLVVDDDEKIRTALKRVLRGEPYDLERATS